MKALIVTKILLTALFCSVLCSCTYLKYSAAQAQYARIQNAQPSQLNLKHMLDTETYFLYGKTLDELNLYADSSIAISAFSNRFSRNERVDTMFVKGAGTHFGLNLPEGSYTILVFVDKNDDTSFDRSEVVGEYQVALNKVNSPEKVVGHVDIRLTRSKPNEWAESFPMPQHDDKKESLFYPSGTIRSLYDPIFDDDMATLGMYDPASFLEHAPTMFYALEEDTAYRYPWCLCTA